MTAGNKSVTDTILTAVFFAVFLIHPSDVIYLVRKFYPASEIYGVHWNIYRIIVALAMLELSLIILGASVILATEDVGEFINQPHNPAVLIAFTLVSILILSQIHIVFAGLRNINTIRKNYRSQLLDSI